MDGYLVIKGPEAKLREFILNFRAQPPAGWLPQEFDQRLAASLLSADNFVSFDSPKIAGHSYSLSLIITQGCLQIHTMHRNRESPFEPEEIYVRDQLRVIHRFYTDCAKAALAADPELEIAKLNLDMDPADPDLEHVDFEHVDFANVKLEDLDWVDEDEDEYGGEAAGGDVDGDKDSDEV
ncbi:MAG: hypothetical protein NXI24_22255 [bacterium]|nr:hypothetical protein [bacterium]